MMPFVTPLIGTFIIQHYHKCLQQKSKHVAELKDILYSTLFTIAGRKKTGNSHAHKHTYTHGKHLTINNTILHKYALITAVALSQNSTHNELVDIRYR